MHRRARVVDAGVLALEPGVVPLELDGVVEALAVHPGSDDDLVATRGPLLRVHGAERWAVGPCVLEDRVLVERTGTVGRLPSTPQQCRDLVLDDLGQHEGGRPGLPVGAVIGLRSAGEDLVLDRLAGGVVHRAVLRAREVCARKRPEEAEDLAGHATGEVPLVAVRRARGKDDLERRVRADRGGGEDLVDAELRAPLEADLAVRRGELGGPVHQCHPVLGLTRCEQLVHDRAAPPGPVVSPVPRTWTTAWMYPRVTKKGDGCCEETYGAWVNRTGNGPDARSPVARSAG